MWVASVPTRVAYDANVEQGAETCTVQRTSWKECVLDASTRGASNVLYKYRESGGAADNFDANDEQDAGRKQVCDGASDPFSYPNDADVFDENGAASAHRLWRLDERRPKEWCQIV